MKTHLNAISVLNAKVSSTLPDTGKWEQLLKINACPAFRLMGEELCFFSIMAFSTKSSLFPTGMGWGGIFNQHPSTLSLTGDISKM